MLRKIARSVCRCYPPTYGRHIMHYVLSKSYRNIVTYIATTIPYRAALICFLSP